MSVEWLSPATYSIVVAGAIDFRQHHPAWYRQIGLLSEEELKVAVATLAVLPVGFRFNAGNILLVVDLNKWQIQATSRASQKLMCQFVRRVFDEKLNETMIQAYGINVNGFLSSAAEVGTFAAKTVLDGLDLTVPGKKHWGSFFFHAEQGGRDVNFGLDLATAENDKVALNYNVNYPLAGLKGYFSLGDAVEETLSADWDAGENFAKQFVERMTRSVEGRHGTGRNRS